MLVLAPLELLGILFLLYLSFRAFRWALNSQKLDSVIEEVANPHIHTLDVATQRLHDAGLLAEKTLAATDAEAAEKRKKADRLRKTYGG